MAARLLVLLETPGPSLAPVRFVSRDNPTGTAANLRRAFAAAGVGRTDTVIWNTVPWLLHGPGERNRAPSKAEIEAGLQVLPALLDHLAQLRAVVLAGRIAGLAEPVIASLRPELNLVRVAHPSPTYVNTRKDIFAGIVAGLAAAATTTTSSSAKSGTPAVADQQRAAQIEG